LAATVVRLEQLKLGSSIFGKGDQINYEPAIDKPPLNWKGMIIVTWPILNFGGPWNYLS